MTRFAFIDDAGVSQRESRFVVAGIVMHRDRQTALIEDRLARIASDIRPDLPTVVLHASDLWHGSRDFHRDRYGQEDRRNTVSKIASLASEFKLPVVFGQCPRSKYPPVPGASKTDREMREALPHLMAQFSCSLMVEWWMRNHAQDEVAQLVHEDIPRSKTNLKMFHNWARDPVVGRELAPNATPYTHIKGPIYYADKYEERILQLADTCAFTICRHMAGNSDIAPIFEILKPQIVEWERTSSL